MSELAKVWDGYARVFEVAGIDCTQGIGKGGFLKFSQVDDAVTVVREMNRVARQRVVISDLRRSIFAVAGIWAASFPLGLHPASRHDGVVSVMRGFLSEELSDIVKTATGVVPDVSHRLGFRVTAGWKPS